MKRRVLITGSNGMLGVDLSWELNKDYEVIGVDFVMRLPYREVTDFYKLDITDRNSTAYVIKKARPDIVVHAAAYTDVDECELNPKKAYKVNSEGTKNVALACKAADVPLIYISTDFVFDGKKKKPYKETDKANPLSIYGDSKLKGEETIRDILKKYFILRTSWLYGKHGKNFVNTIIAKAKKEKMLKVVDDQAGSPTYTKDLAKAIHVLLNKVLSLFDVHRRDDMSFSTTTPQRWARVYHVSNSGSVSWFDYTKEILKLAKLKTKVIPISSKELARPAKRPAMSVLDNSKFAKFTGYKMRNWREALKEYV